MGQTHEERAWYEDMLIWVLGWVEDYPGLWTARLCRLINGLPETEQSVIYCGRCSEYANLRKRLRAQKYAAMPTLPGLEPPYQLHGPCPKLNLRRLRGLLEKLRDECDMVRCQTEHIPDVRNHRGWDWATTWYPN